MRTLLPRAVRALALSALLAAPLAAQTPSRPPLFRAQGPRGTVYLLGSMHLLPADAYPLDPSVERAYAAAERVVFETRMDSLEARARELGALAMRTDGGTLRQTLSPATYARLEQVLPGYGMQPAQAQAMKPGFLSMILPVAAAVRAGITGEHGLDIVLTRRALRDGKAVGGLEGVSEQMAVMDRVSPAGQEHMLRLSLMPVDSQVQRARALARAWRTGDEAALQALFAPLAADSSVYLPLVSGRNRRWAPQVETMLRAPGTSLVVVGAGHLVGPDNLVDLLRRDGFHVERL